MFNTLASYLLGTSNTSANSDQGIQDANGTNTRNNENPLSSIQSEDNIQLRAICCEDEDDDWLLVDREEEESLPRTDSEEELPFVEIKRSPLTQRPNNNLRHRRTGSGGSSSSNLSPSQDGVSQQLYCVSPNGLHPPASMEESWFVTPPPCFTSTGPVHMETSPLENLLIEHPSMSVYHSIRTMQENEDDLVVLDITLEEAETDPVAERSPVHTTRVVRSRAERVEHLTQQQIKQGVLQRNAQKNHDKKTRQILCRGAIDRGNKVRDFNSKGGRQKRRSDMQHCMTISRANNNRKC